MAIYKPTIPITSIEGGLQEGKSVIIIGRILPGDSNRLHVNLQCGSDSDADIALHINPCFENGSGHIVYNTNQNGSWGSKLSTPDSPIISANGKHLMDYKHLIPITKVNTISVDQNIKLEFIGYQNSLVVPYKTLINGGLQPGNGIVIYGVPNDSERVEFNLLHRYGIAFHYLSLFDENMVVRNTSENGKWGAEERSGGVPFMKGQLFQVKISCNAEQYDVSVNGQQAHTYKHRFTELEDIDVSEVYGELQLIFVHV
ncbi:galectin-5-like [Garra rufa]|uniref:galectin-5-like n=1 Tax=Garra rufa TaxID=137080 RepID=UPI003CCEB6CD